MKYKLVSFIAAFALVVSLLPVGTFASEDVTYGPAVKLLMDLGVMGVDEYLGKFWDDTPVRRSEMVKILCNLFNLEPQKAETPCFDDVSENDRGYIEAVVINGYMSGYGDREFGPDDYVTGQQVLKIFVSIECGDALPQAMGGFPDGYYKAAKKMGMISASTLVSEDAARRIDVAEIIYSVLESDAIRISGIDGDNIIYESVEGATFLSDIIGIYRYEGILCKNKATALTEPSGTGDERVQIGEAVINDTEDLARDYLGCKVIAYAKKTSGEDSYNIVSIMEAKTNNSLKINVEDFVGAAGFKFEYYAGNKVKTIQMSPGCKMIYNGVLTNYDESKFNFNIGEIKLMDNNDDGKYDVVLITDYKTIIVERINVKDETISSRFGNENLELKDSYCRITYDDEKAELDGISAGAVILAAVSENTADIKAIDIKVSTTKVAGTVETKRDNEDGVFVDVGGETYKISKYAQSLADTGAIPRIDAGDSVQLFLDAFGNVAYYKKNAAGLSVGYLMAGVVDPGVLTPIIRVKIFTEKEEIIYLQAGESVKVNGEKVKIDKMDDALKNRFVETGLVEYEAENDVLQSINFPNDGYSVDEFSLDDSDDSFRCSSRNMLARKYKVSDSTPVFIVPGKSTDENKEDHHVVNGNYFSISHNYAANLYDIDEYGNVKYCVVKKDGMAEDDIEESTKLVIVEYVGVGLDDEGEEIDLICGVDENGKEISLPVKDKALMTFQVNADGETKTRPLKGGDVIQYITYKDGSASKIALAHNSDAGGTFREPCSLLTWRGASYNMERVYGTIVRINGYSAIVICGDEWAGKTILDANKHITLSGNAVYLYDSQRDKVMPIAFSDISEGDRVFACTNQNNNLRMLVVYK